jgi:hypothetical protein
MPNKLPDLKTTLVKEDLAKSVWDAWCYLFGSNPKKESIWVLLAQIQLETGLKYCHNFNLGNVKSVDGDGYDYQFFGCGEELPLIQAQRAVHDSPLVKVVRTYMKGTTQMASVWIDPEHPWCRFRAFHSLLEGAVDYVKLLNKRFQKSWPAVIAGDPALFAHLLKVQGYYTADESVYVASVKSCFNEWAKLNVDYTTSLDLSQEEKTRVQNLVALTMAQSLDELLSTPSTLDSEEELV